MKLTPSGLHSFARRLSWFAYAAPVGALLQLPAVIWTGVGLLLASVVLAAAAARRMTPGQRNALRRRETQKALTPNAALAHAVAAVAAVVTYAFGFALSQSHDSGMHITGVIVGLIGLAVALFSFRSRR